MDIFLGLMLGKYWGYGRHVKTEKTLKHTTQKKRGGSANLAESYHWIPKTYQKVTRKLANIYSHIAHYMLKNTNKISHLWSGT